MSRNRIRSLNLVLALSPNLVMLKMVGNLVDVGDARDAMPVSFFFFFFFLFFFFFYLFFFFRKFGQERKCKMIIVLSGF